uniref:LYR motif-containing protein 5 n=1 Tax=Caenorhabditis tropicalis TaxID=1561998 RepID=A0A1I7TI83_9PELO
MIFYESLTISHKSIGLEELRSILGFKPRGLLKPLRMKPNETELAAASTVEEYYELKEPQYVDLSLSSYSVLKKNVEKAVKFLDRRFPEYRNYYRTKLQRALRNRNVDKDTVDEMIEEFEFVQQQVNEALMGFHPSSFYRKKEKICE